MARVRQWLPGFMKRHCARFNPHDWPDGQDDEDMAAFLGGWITAFAAREVTASEAEEASEALALTPPNFRREHLPMVVAAIETLRQQRGVKPGAGTREAVRDESRDCPYCSGGGLATAWAEAPDAARRIPETVAAHCVCPHGRWIRKAHAEKHPELLRGIPDFGEVLDGVKRGWLAHPPGSPEFAVDFGADPEPEDVPPAPSRATIAEMFRTPY